VGKKPRQNHNSKFIESGHRGYYRSCYFSCYSMGEIFDTPFKQEFYFGSPFLYHFMEEVIKMFILPHRSLIDDTFTVIQRGG